MCTTKRKTHQTEVHKMNEKITRQVEEMKQQTIGVEVEMNSMTRDINVYLKRDKPDHIKRDICYHR
uniref:Uncharacterized protein n=1 Tax=Siphoviridae sp. ctquf9 TaxID=2826470 RepID=A0A8S5M3X5_9CAUD|nr:MAG TPA: hypothetical protein [Siphoviridae sp. ctquf9]